MIGDAEIRFRINTTGNASPKLHLILDENWQQAMDAETCREKLGTARLTRRFSIGLLMDQMRDPGVVKNMHG